MYSWHSMFRPFRKVKKKRENRFSVNSQNLLYTIFCESTVFSTWFSGKVFVLMHSNTIFPYVLMHSNTIFAYVLMHSNTIFAYVLMHSNTIFPYVLMHSNTIFPYVLMHSNTIFAYVLMHSNTIFPYVLMHSNTIFAYVLMHSHTIFAYVSPPVLFMILLGGSIMVRLRLQQNGLDTWKVPSRAARGQQERWVAAVPTFNFWTSWPDIDQHLVVQTPMQSMPKISQAHQRPTHVACNSKLHSVVRSSITGIIHDRTPNCHPFF